MPKPVINERHLSMSHQYVLEFAALSDIGRVRKHNEDAIVVCSDYGCAVLADGMGGYKAGEVASAMTAKIATTTPIDQKSGQNWNSATPMASTPPVNAPA